MLLVVPTLHDMQSYHRNVSSNQSSSLNCPMVSFPLLKASAKPVAKRPLNRILSPWEESSNKDLGGDLQEEECMQTSRDNAIVSLLWIDTQSKDKDQTSRRYQAARSLIADALILGASLQGCQARRILLISQNALNICGSQLLFKFWELRYTCSLIDLRLEDSDPQHLRYCIALTKLRALELIEFRKVLVMDLSMVAKKGRKVDNLFSYETPAAAPGNAGLLLLKPNREKYEWLTKMLHKRSSRGSCGPLKDYLKWMYKDWNPITCDFNFQVNMLYKLQDQPLSRDAMPRRFKWEDINIIHFDGQLSPREWLFRGGKRVTLDNWVKNHLLPNYGTLDESSKQIVSETTKHWEKVWGVVQGAITWYNNLESQRVEWCRGKLMTCQPWVINGLNIPTLENICHACTSWPLQSKQDIVSGEQRSTTLVDHDTFSGPPKPPQPFTAPFSDSLRHVPPPPPANRKIPPPPPPPMTERRRSRSPTRRYRQTIGSWGSKSEW